MINQSDPLMLRGKLRAFAEYLNRRNMTDESAK
jgi:hypothetical protein